MGIDCMLFAKNAKKCRWVARHRNVAAIASHEEHPGTWWLGYLEGLSRGGVGEDWSEAGDAHRAVASSFIREHGEDDTYFIVTDHYDPSCHEYAEDNSFEMEE